VVVSSCIFNAFTLIFRYDYVHLTPIPYTLYLGEEVKDDDIDARVLSQAIILAKEGQ
jgi:hypothetical protein